MDLSDFPKALGAKLATQASAASPSLPGIAAGNALAALGRPSLAAATGFHALAVTTAHLAEAARIEAGFDISLLANSIAEVNGRMSAAMGSFRHVHDEIMRAGETLRRAAEGFRCVMEPAMSSLAALNAIRPVALDFTPLREIQLHTARAFEGFSAFRNFALSPLVGRLILIEEETEDLHDFLISRSWYLSPSSPLTLVFEIMRLLESEEEERAEDLMAKWFAGSIAEIELSLIAQYPRRQRFFEEAFEAHRRGLYTLSMPAFLAQVDGIALDLWGAPFFSGKSIPIVEGHIRKLNNSAFGSWLRPLTKRGAIREDTRAPSSAGAASLNRHSVMHGMRDDHATEANSLKCVSLLEFMRSVAFAFERQE